jgi:hypothetical protein
MSRAHREAVLFWLCLFAAVLSARLCHARVLWADEDYHLAAAIQVLFGKVPYRDFWYDKPPLNLAFYLLFGARTGVVLRVADALFVCFCCALAYRFASRLWMRREGFLAAGALAFFLIFYLSPGIIPLEPDTFLLAPHLGAVYLAWRRRPFLSGLVAGIAFQLSPKGAFVLASAALFAPASLPMLVMGFLIPAAITLGWLAAAGAWTGYFEQVWRWGLLYAGTPQNGRGLANVFHWLGFHAALVLGAGWYWIKDKSPDRVKTLGWCALSLVAAAIGWRFAPRYFIQLLPALAIPAACGYSRATRTMRALIVIALAVPLVRFGPRYIELARGSPLTDTAMDRESREATQIIRATARPGDTIFVWGYRPDIVAYTRLPVSGLIWDSQPVTGVPADRHLSDSRPVSETLARANRRALIGSKPSVLVDGLSLYNPQLDIHKYADLAPWLAGYCVVGRVVGTTVYRLCGRVDNPPPVGNWPH